jgi:hypothetical protein
VLWEHEIVSEPTTLTNPTATAEPGSHLELTIQISLVPWSSSTAKNSASPTTLAWLPPAPAEVHLLMTWRSSGTSCQETPS